MQRAPLRRAAHERMSSLPGWRQHIGRQYACVLDQRKGTHTATQSLPLRVSRISRCASYLKKRATIDEVVPCSACKACAAAVMAHTTMPSMPCGPMKDCMFRVRRKGTVSWPRSSWKRESYVDMRSAWVMVPMLRETSSLLGERPVSRRMWQAMAAEQRGRPRKIASFLYQR